MNCSRFGSNRIIAPSLSKSGAAAMSIVASTNETVVVQKVVYEISGGNLGINGGLGPWKPRDTEMIDGRAFVILNERDYMLSVYLGISHCSGFYVHLRSVRNAEVDKLILARIREDDAFAIAVPAAVRRNPPDLGVTTFPLTLDGCGQIELVLEMNPRKKVMMHLSKDNLMVLNAYAKCYMCDYSRKRKRAPSVVVDHKFVTKNLFRKTVSADCRYSHGETVGHVIRVRGEWNQESVDIAVEELIDHLKNNHYAEDAMGDMVLASDYKLDIFADM